MRKTNKLAPSSWKLCTDPELIKMRDEVWAEANKLGYVSENAIKPTLFTFKSSNKWGETRYWKNDQNGESIVGIERVFLKNPPSAKETMVHEIAHVLAKGNGHGPVWKSRGNKLGKIYNVDMSTSDSPEDIGIDIHLLDYHILCPKCQKVYHYPEQNTIWKNTQNYICGYCGHLGLKKSDADGNILKEEV